MRKTVLSISLICALASGYAQSGLSFYHLGNSTFQNSFYNPALIPEGKVFVGLPGLSGVHAGFNNKFSYSEFVVAGESGQKRPDLRLLVSHLQKNNLVSADVTLSWFHVAITAPSGMNFSLFANERVEVDFLYPKSLIQLAAEGTFDFVGETVKLGRTRLSATHFREIGVGLALPVPDKGLTVGFRVKYLQGFFNASTPLNFRGNLTTSPETYALTLDMKEATVRTSGMDIARGNTGNLAAHLASNGNRGAAVEAGFHWEMDGNNAISASVTDLGFISWKEDIKNYTMGDTTFSDYQGINLEDPSNLEDQVKDSLINRFKDKITDNSEPYTTLTGPRVFCSWTYHTPFGGDVISTAGTRFIQGRFKVLAGVGYRHSFGKIFTGSVNITRLPQQFLNLGAALAVNGGPAQLYLAVDQLATYDATKFKAIDVRVGINLVFGRGKKEESAFANNDSSGGKTKDSPGSHSFLGSKVRAKRQEGIYTIIPKQKRRNPKEYHKTDPDN